MFEIEKILSLSSQSDRKIQAVTVVNNFNMKLSTKNFTWHGTTVEEVMITCADVLAITTPHVQMIYRNPILGIDGKVSPKVIFLCL